MTIEHFVKKWHDIKVLLKIFQYDSVHYYNIGDNNQLAASWQ